MSKPKKITCNSTLYIYFFVSSLAMSGPRVSNEIRVSPLIQAWPSLTGKVELLFLNPFCLRGIFLPTNSPLLLGWSIATIRLWISTRRNTLCVKPMIIVSLFFGLLHLFFFFFFFATLTLPLFHRASVVYNLEVGSKSCKNYCFLTDENARIQMENVKMCWESLGLVGNNDCTNFQPFWFINKKVLVVVYIFVWLVWESLSGPNGRVKAAPFFTIY